MLTSIHKFQVYPGTTCYVNCGEIVHFGEQHGAFYVWAKSTNVWSRPVRLVMTGEEFDEYAFNRYIGTVITDGGSFVVHAFTS